MQKNIILSFVFIFLIKSTSFAACGLSLNTGNITTSWNTNWTTQSISITVNKSDAGACTFGLGFSKGGSASYTRYAQVAGKQLHYQVYQDSGKTKILKDVPDVATVNDVIMVTLPPGNNPQTVQYFFDVPYSLATTPVLAGSGTYVDNFTINAYEGADPSTFSSLPDATAPVVLNVDVAPQISISLADAGGSFISGSNTKSINFGNTHSGQVSRFDMLISTNAGLSVTMSSANAGRLKHTTKNTYVPYSISVNNANADLTGVAPVVTTGGQTSSNGLVYPVRVVIGSISSSAIAGSYQDSVTITAVTIE